MDISRSHKRALGLRLEHSARLVLEAAVCLVEHIGKRSRKLVYRCLEVGNSVVSVLVTGRVNAVAVNHIVVALELTGSEI